MVATTYGMTFDSHYNLVFDSLLNLIRLTKDDILGATLAISPSNCQPPELHRWLACLSVALGCYLLIKVLYVYKVKVLGM